MFIQDWPVGVCVCLCIKKRTSECLCIHVWTNVCVIENWVDSRECTVRGCGVIWWCHCLECFHPKTSNLWMSLKVLAQSDFQFLSPPLYPSKSKLSGEGKGCVGIGFLFYHNADTVNSDGSSHLMYTLISLNLHLQIKQKMRGYLYY